jgi:peptide-methionine (S)-S-oxide reductase
MQSQVKQIGQIFRRGGNMEKYLADAEQARTGSTRSSRATFGAGCFWHVEETFRHVPGVVSTSVGFMGGTTKDPSYKEVCTGQTGHAEVVQVTYDPSKIGYDRLLDVFWGEHDPTTRNRQGRDVGEQYRSVIFYHTEEQKAKALASKEKLAKSGRYDGEIVTAIEPAGEFYLAEEYHQQYIEKHSGMASCRVR